MKKIYNYIPFIATFAIFAILSFNGIAGEVIASTTAACDSLNITCQAMPLLDLLDFMPLIIAKIPGILIPLVIVMVLAGAIIAVGAIPIAIVALIVSLSRGLTNKLKMK